MTLCHACSISKLRHEFILLQTPGHVSLSGQSVQSVSGRAGEERHLQNTVRTGHSHESLSCQPTLVIYSSNANINGLIFVRLGLVDL